MMSTFSHVLFSLSFPFSKNATGLVIKRSLEVGHCNTVVMRVRRGIGRYKFCTEEVGHLGKRSWLEQTAPLFPTEQHRQRHLGIRGI